MSMRVLTWVMISAAASALALSGCGGGGGGGGGGSGSGGSAGEASTNETGGAGGSSSGGTGGSGSGGEAGATNTTQGIVSEAEPRSGIAMVAGGELSRSENFTMIATFGEEPGGNRSMHSESNRLNLGVVGATQP